MLFKITSATEIQTTFRQNEIKDVLHSGNISLSEILYSVWKR